VLELVSMTEAYLHIVTLPGRCPPDPEQLSADGEEGNATEGMLLFMSTSSHRLCDYIVCHSVEEYGMGFALDTWRYRGTLGSNGFPVGVSSTYELAGPVHTEGFLFKNASGYVDLYVRASISIPRHRFAHYQLNVSEPDQFWKASVYRYIETVHRPSLVELVGSTRFD